jgi:hypothetical protein
MKIKKNIFSTLVIELPTVINWKSQKIKIRLPYCPLSHTASNYDTLSTSHTPSQDGLITVGLILAITQANTHYTDFHHNFHTLFTPPAFFSHTATCRAGQVLLYLSPKHTFHYQNLPTHFSHTVSFSHPLTHCTMKGWLGLILALTQTHSAHTILTYTLLTLCLPFHTLSHEGFIRPVSSCLKMFHTIFKHTWPSSHTLFSS